MASYTPGDGVLTLVTSPPSPFGRKVGVALREKGVPYSVAYDLPWEAGTRTPELNPFEQVPVLVVDGGEAIFDSSYILEWLEVTFPFPALVPGDGSARLSTKRRQMLGERLMLIAQSLVLETYRESPSQAWIDRQSRKIVAGLSALEGEYLARSVEGLSVLDLGDIAAGTTLLMFEFMVEAGLSPPLDELGWRRRDDALRSFVEVVEARDSFTSTTPAPMSVDLNATVG